MNTAENLIPKKPLKVITNLKGVLRHPFGFLKEKYEFVCILNGIKYLLLNFVIQRQSNEPFSAAVIHISRQ